MKHYGVYKGNKLNIGWDKLSCTNNARKSSVYDIPGRNGKDIHGVMRNTNLKHHIRIKLKKIRRSKLKEELCNIINKNL